MDGQIHVSQQEHLLRVVFDRPAKKNAFTVVMYEALVEVMRRAEDEEIRVVLFSGEGDAFTSGNDLTDFINQPPLDRSHPVIQFLHALVDCRTPLIAAVDGPAIGIGTTMLLHFDLVLATQRAQFRMPFVPLGLVPEGGSSLLLPQRLGSSIASELLLLGDPVSAERAHALGLVNEIVSDKNLLLDQALEAVDKFLRLPPRALRQARELIRGPSREARHHAIDVEAEAFVNCLKSPEAIEAMAAIVQKRSPNFS
ncbi:MAG: enoyl-CoA hydratase/isomerase family protein [Myxococcales bacterium]|nr:enoyl-CoA hydratase/isomerase family protein [Myxococcales bacterium]